MADALLDERRANLSRFPDMSNRAGAYCSQLTNRATSPNTNVTERDNKWDPKIAPWAECQAAQARVRGIETIDSEL